MTTRSTIAAFLNAAGLALYGVGLISPLTPSEGMPDVLELFIFVSCPVAFLLVSLGLSRTRLARAVALAEVVALVGFTTWLLWLQARTT